MTTVAAPSRWESYAQATRIDHFAWWCSEHCVQTVDRFAGEPLALEDWQLEMMGEALAELSEDEAYWLTVGLIVPKKNGKTSILAAYGLYHLLEDDGSPEILLAAASDKQAGRLFKAATAYVRSDPWLAAQVVVRDHEGEIARADGFGVLYRVSADSGALSGYNPSLVIADELADWRTPRRRRAWSMLATGGIARSQVHVFAISTAGEPEERAAGILGQMIDRNELDGKVERVHRALTVSRNHKARTLIYNYDARTHNVDDLDAIKAANPASWITRERLAELAANPSLTPGRFLQLHGCVWTASQGAFIGLEAWRALGRPQTIAPGDEITVGFRGADTAALVACRRVDGLIDLVELFADASDAGEVDDALRALLSRFSVLGVFSSHTAAWATIVDGWRRELGRGRVTDIDVSTPSHHTAQITERFRADATAGRITHSGKRELDAHVVAARLARHRNLPHLVSDVRRDAPIAGALAALLAWEARTVLGAASGIKKPGRAVWS